MTSHRQPSFSHTTTTVRPVQISDSDTLLHTCWPTRSREQVVELLRRAERLAFNRRGLGVVAVHHNRVCGFGMVTLWPRAAEISDLIVAQTLREQGIGSQIITHLTRAAQRLNAEIVEIGAAHANQRAIALYRRLGFEDSRTIVLNLGSGLEPVLYLAKTLHAAEQQRQA